MENTETETEQAVKRIKMSEIRAAMENEAVDFDVVGVLVYVNSDEVLSCRHDEGLEKRDEHLLCMFQYAMCALASSAFALDPMAWSVLGEWTARNFERHSKQKRLAELLKELDDKDESEAEAEAEA